MEIAQVEKVLSYMRSHRPDMAYRHVSRIVRDGHWYIRFQSHPKDMLEVAKAVAGIWPEARVTCSYTLGTGCAFIDAQL